MTKEEDKAVGMVRVTVKLRPDQYDELFQYVREVGSTMSAFFRESAMTAMREAHLTGRAVTRCGIIGDAGPNWPGRVVTSATRGRLSEGNRTL